MALDITVTKVSVTEPQSGMFNVVLNLICTDPDQADLEVINRDFTQRKKDHISIVTVQGRFIVDMQDYIDQYLREQELFTHAALESSVVAIQAALVGG